MVPVRPYPAVMPTRATPKRLVLLHLSPKHVCIDERRAGNVTPLGELMPTMRRGGIAAVSEVGVLGDPTTATAAAGARFFSEMVEACVTRVRRWTPGGDGMLQMTRAGEDGAGAAGGGARPSPRCGWGYPHSRASGAYDPAEVAGRICCPG